MNLHTLILTNNACYKAGRTIVPQGIMVHSTGANNPWLKRYVGPDDGLLGRNRHNNHWNQDRPGGRQVCVHAFIGKLADGSVATYQTLPWDHRGWHCGRGPKGTGNDTHISFEICEDNLSDAAYFHEAAREAAELCEFLCKLHGLNERDVICHSEGHRLGIASNHADVMHWFPRHGACMDSFRAAVRNGLIAHDARIIAHDARSSAPDSAPASAAADTFYRVRKSRDDAKSQKGAFRTLENAKRHADANPGWSVFDSMGTMVYGGTSAAGCEIYTAAEGDSLWKIAAAKLGSGRRYQEIKVLNGLLSDTIFPGQILKIPKL